MPVHVGRAGETLEVVLPGDLAAEHHEIADRGDERERARWAALRGDPEMGEQRDVPGPADRCDLFGKWRVDVEAAMSRDAADEDPAWAGGPHLVIAELGGVGEFEEAACVEETPPAVRAGWPGETGGEHRLALALRETADGAEELERLSGGRVGRGTHATGRYGAFCVAGASVMCLVEIAASVLTVETIGPVLSPKGDSATGIRMSTVRVLPRAFLRLCSSYRHLYG
jgi:hypothetical protein